MSSEDARAEQRSTLTCCVLQLTRSLDISSIFELCQVATGTRDADTSSKLACTARQRDICLSRGQAVLLRSLPFSCVKQHVPVAAACGLRPDAGFVMA